MEKQLAAAYVFNHFDNADWECYAGTEGNDPRICYVETKRPDIDAVIILDDEVLQIEFINFNLERDWFFLYSAPKGADKDVLVRNLVSRLTGAKLDPFFRKKNDALIGPEFKYLRFYDN